MHPEPLPDRLDDLDMLRNLVIVQQLEAAQLAQQAFMRHLAEKYRLEPGDQWQLDGAIRRVGNLRRLVVPNGPGVPPGFHPS